MSSSSKLLIILPAFNESTVIGEVLNKLKSFTKTIKNIKTEIIVVNDGSSDKTQQIAEEKNIKVLTHIINRGLGGALATGLTYAKKHKYDYALTMDSDGQHSLSDILPMIKPLIQKKADVVIGSRMLGQKGMPWDRVLINTISSIITWVMFQVWTSDSQSGMRAFNQKALNTINLRTQGMEVSTEFFAEIKNKKLTFTEVPIKVIYTDYSRSKGQTNLNSLSVGWKLILRIFR